MRYKGKSTWSFEKGITLSPIKTKERGMGGEFSFSSCRSKTECENQDTGWQNGRREGTGFWWYCQDSEPTHWPCYFIHVKKVWGKKKKESEKQPCGLSHCWRDGFSISCSLVYPHWYIHIYRAVESERKFGCEAQSSSAVNICMAIMM